MQYKPVIAPNGRPAELMSEDGRTWFMQLESLRNFQTRINDTPTLNEDQLRWLELVDLPAEVFNVSDAIRSHVRAS